MAQVAITLNVNGRNQTTLAEPREILADVLRDRLGLTGTHLGCEHGVCGACTVLLDGEMVRSCLLFAVQAQGAEITTIEGLEENGELHPMQKAFSEYHGLQCGFCTPGMILAGIDLLKRNPDPTAEEVRDDMGGNVCRCTGYQKIVESVLGAAREMNEVTS
ncbi:MAG: (2Fe-2S)-binding protein [Acidimicrobiia bacterium]|nr:(2Fe-2S)-binding protein [bacterium]MXW68897.1 (2Fe-2S)-binding protein [Acidimicrobiia bacterium]MDE0674196.1 (2Fe-2S)-binding protein [bacterium]MXX00678.1 (2Fe-2S)-binding protein [Acidimicrobiia bacterium]MXY73779.1 (2Fe-2S)-binding protein [Acidimicrobiia bacterium]